METKENNEYFDAERLVAVVQTGTEIFLLELDQGAVGVQSRQQMKVFGSLLEKLRIVGSFFELGVRLRVHALSLCKT